MHDSICWLNFWTSTSIGCRLIISIRVGKNWPPIFTNASLKDPYKKLIFVDGPLKQPHGKIRLLFPHGFLKQTLQIFFNSSLSSLLSLTSSPRTPVSPPLLHSLPGGARRLQSGTWVPGTPAAGDRGHCARGVRDPPSRVEGGEGWRRPASARI